MFSLCIITNLGSGEDEDAKGRQRETRGRENGGHDGKAWAGEREGGRREGSRDRRRLLPRLTLDLSPVPERPPGSASVRRVILGLQISGSLEAHAHSLSDLSKSVPHSATRVVYVRAATACGGAAGGRTDGRTIAASILKLPPKLPRVRRVYVQRVRPGIDFDSGPETPFLGSCSKGYSFPLTLRINEESGVQENAPSSRERA